MFFFFPPSRPTKGDEFFFFLYGAGARPRFSRCGSWRTSSLSANYYLFPPSCRRFPFFFFFPRGLHIRHFRSLRCKPPKESTLFFPFLFGPALVSIRPATPSFRYRTYSPGTRGFFFLPPKRLAWRRDFVRDRALFPSGAKSLDTIFLSPFSPPVKGRWENFFFFFSVFSHFPKRDCLLSSLSLTRTRLRFFLLPLEGNVKDLGFPSIALSTFGIDFEIICHSPLWRNI